MNIHEYEIKNSQRFDFGRNWANFLREFDESRLDEAKLSIKAMFRVENFHGKTFLDVGSGSGLFSLAAKSLGAKVTSFDYDPNSVLCTNTLKANFFPEDEGWKVYEGSILDENFINSLGEFDYVYSWGVLHHTGNMRKAFSNAINLLKNSGSICIAIYNKQRFASTYWLHIKKLYLKYKFLRPVFFIIHGLYPVLPSYVLRKIQSKSYPRGMSIWYDLIDWLGGYPFEVASPREVVDYFVKENCVLVSLTTVGGNHGCNEFTFIKNKKII